MNLKSKKGFTLVELIIVIAILGIIALIAVPNLTGIQKRSQVNADIRTAEQIGKAVRIGLTEKQLTVTTGSPATTSTIDPGTWYDYSTINNMSSYIATDFEPSSMGLKADEATYYVAYTHDAVTGASRVFVAIGPTTGMTAPTIVYTGAVSGTGATAEVTPGVAYVEGYGTLEAGVEATVGATGSDKVTLEMAS